MGAPPCPGKPRAKRLEFNPENDRGTVKSSRDEGPTLGADNDGGRPGAQIEDLPRRREGSRQDVRDPAVRDGPVRRSLRADAGRESREEGDAGGGPGATREGRHDDGDRG